MKWNEQLRYERQSRGWTQSSLAQKMGTNTFTVSRWENGYAFPHPFYREKLSAILGIQFDEKDFLEDDTAEFDNNISEKSEVVSEVEQIQHEDNNSQTLPIPVAELQEAISVDQDSQPREQEKQQAEDHLLQLDIHLKMKPLPVFKPPFHRFLWRSLLILSTFLIAIVVISRTVPLVFIRQPSHKSLPIQASYSPPIYSLSIQNTSPALTPIVQELQDAFKAVYPQLVKRFALDPASAAQKIVTLTLVPDLSSPASISGTTITLSVVWIQEHPNDIGLLTHELTLLTQAYPAGAPGWFSDGMADYARYVYGPADDDSWSLPDRVQPQDSYLQGGGVAVRFLVWLEEHKAPNIIDQLNHALQTKQSFPAVFSRLTHQTVNALWGQYKAHPDISQTPEQLYKTVTSRKPIYYQSSTLDVQCTWDGGLHFEFLPDLYMSNFAVQVEMTIIKGKGGGFIIRSGHQGHYRFRLSPDGTYDLVSSTVGLTLGSSQAASLGLKQTNQLTIIAQKHKIYVYINGQFTTEANDTTSSYGIIGGMAYDTDAPTDVQFQDIQVF